MSTDVGVVAVEGAGGVGDEGAALTGHTSGAGGDVSVGVNEDESVRATARLAGDGEDKAVFHVVDDGFACFVSLYVHRNHGAAARVGSSHT